MFIDEKGFERGWEKVKEKVGKKAKNGSSHVVSAAGG